MHADGVPANGEEQEGMHQVLFGTALLTSFLGGVVALLAPCCVSVMLPAFFATGFSRRTGIAVAAGVFAAGGTAVLGGWKPMLPVPSLRSPSGHGYGAAYGLGLFSGFASACCAPVLAGVVVLTGATASFGSALAVSVTYVAGMVVPLAVLALVWESRDWGSSRLLAGRRVRLGIGRFSRRMPLGAAASGIVLAAMGAVTLVTAVTGPSMSSSGWRESMTAWLQHASSVTGRALSWLPGWKVLLALAVLAAALAVAASRARLRHGGPAGSVPSTDDQPVPRGTEAGADSSGMRAETVSRER